jgi:uncharacterized membrane protein
VLRRFPLLLLLRRLAADERGNIALLFAVFMALGTVAGAFAIDEGAIYLQRRIEQSAADLGAITAASDPAHAFARARQALVDAGLVPASTTVEELTTGRSASRLTVETGNYAADPAIPVTGRFRPGGSPLNAVRVHFEQPAQLYFAQPWAQVPVLAVDAVAAATPTVAFSVGSTLATLGEGIPNAVLNALLGSNVTLSAASYNALLDAHVGLFPLLDALAEELGITAGTYQDVLAASADQGTIAKAIADVSTGPAVPAALALAQALGHNGRVPLARLLDLGALAGYSIGQGSASGIAASLSALQLLAATAAISDGTHEVALGLGADVPGLTSLTLTLAVGEPAQHAAWFALGPSGEIVRTAQIRLKFVATLAGGAGLGQGVVRLPLYLEGASAEAGVTSAACPVAPAASGTAVIAARPGIASIAIGEPSDSELGDFGRDAPLVPATLIDLPLLKIVASGRASMGNRTPTSLSFSAADIAAGTVRRATTTDYTRSLTSSLLQHLTLTVTIGGLNVSASGVGRALGALLDPLGPVLDSTIATALGALGLNLGIADVRVYGVTCGRAVLVQ